MSTLVNRNILFRVNLPADLSLHSLHSVILWPFTLAVSTLPTNSFSKQTVDSSSLITWLPGHHHQAFQHLFCLKACSENEARSGAWNWISWPYSNDVVRTSEIVKFYISKLLGHHYLFEKTCCKIWVSYMSLVLWPDLSSKKFNLVHQTISWWWSLHGNKTTKAFRVWNMGWADTYSVT